MRPLRRPSKYAVLFLLASLLPAWMAGGLPLVWCVGPNGHSAIEALAFNDCHDGSTSAFRDQEVGGEKEDCTDFGIWQRAEAPKKQLASALPSPEPGTAAAEIPATLHCIPTCERQGARHDVDFVGHQLAQLRTVILLI